MEEWKEYKLGEITNMKNGKKRPQSNGVFPVYGGNGIMDYSDSYNAENAIIVGRVGAYCGCVYKCDGKCWVSDNAISVFAKDIVDTQFLYYLMTTVDFHHHHIGGAQPLMTQDIIGDFTVSIPPLSVQNQIVHILKSFDDKIEVNRQINDNLEQQAQALFKSWFVDFEPFKYGEFVESVLGMIPKGWRVGTLDDLLEIKYGKDHKKLSDGKIPVYGSGGLMRRVDKSLYKGESVLIPRKGTLNNVMYVNEEFWTVDTMFYTIPKVEHIALFCYLFLLGKDLASMNAGSAVPSMTTEILNSMSVVIPQNSIVNEFDNVISSYFRKIENNDNESRRLAELRDTLLPKLMSGELNVFDKPNDQS